MLFGEGWFHSLGVLVGGVARAQLLVVCDARGLSEDASTHTPKQDQHTGFNRQGPGPHHAHAHAVLCCCRRCLWCTTWPALTGRQTGWRSPATQLHT